MSKLTKLRNIFKKFKISAFLIPTNDAHNSEYPCSIDKRREFITEFSGSAGTALVTQKNAFLWVDGRYWIEAEKTVSKEWKVFFQGKEGVPDPFKWINEHINEIDILGIDPKCTNLEMYKNVKNKYPKIKIKFCDTNPVDLIWDNKPKNPQKDIFHLPIEYSGISLKNKLTTIKNKIKENKSNGIIINCLDEIAWVFNLRGNDIVYNPVFKSFCILIDEKTVLFINGKLDQNSLKKLNENDVEIREYDQFYSYIDYLNIKLKSEKNIKKILITPSTCNLSIYNRLDNQFIKEDNESILCKMKAIKNNTEIEGMKRCHIRDGAAKTAWISWLEEKIKNKENISEIRAANKLEEYRSKQKNYISLSFESISASGKNGAIIHYRPNKKKEVMIDPNNLYLIDSGAQYLDGTTDVTRTIHFSTPTKEQKKLFTLVLKGHIALAKAVFPKVSASFLDTFARQFLWKNGLDYKHGTGHGIGSFLNVHEGPHYISIANKLSVPIINGMFVSNEPGYYKENNFGIRIESIMLSKESKTKKNFFKFETVTMVPIQKELIEMDLMTQLEIDWLNKYHEKVKFNLKGFFKDDKRAMGYLNRACSPLIK